MVQFGLVWYAGCSKQKVMGVVVVDFSWGYVTCQFWICFTQFDSRPFGKNLYLGVGFGLLLGRCICDLLCTTSNMRLADVRAVTQQEVMDAEIKLNKELLLQLRSNTSIRKETTDAILVCACRSICKPEMPGTTMTRPLEGYLIPVRRVRDQYLTGADKEAIKKGFVFGAAYPFEDDEDDLPSNARWLSIRNRSLVVSAKEMSAGESTLLRGEALKKLRSLDAEQSIFIASGSGAAASAPAAAQTGWNWRAVSISYGCLYRFSML